jgi:hypothetical protein
MHNVSGQQEWNKRRRKKENLRFEVEIRSRLE